MQNQVKYKITVLFLLLFAHAVSWAQNMRLSEMAEISVITCSPGIEAYSVYGHSAIRVKDEMYNYDVVFNYCIFDFSAPNFVYRFSSGHTDYLLGAYHFADFYKEYEQEKRSIYEQVLNISLKEKQNIFDFLIWNAQPENRVYRYNFFFDNCATRVRDVVQQQVETEVIFPEYPVNKKTYRELIKEYHSKLCWLNFGIDLVVSAPSDKTAPAYDEMFLPDYLMEHFANSTLVTETGEKPLVKSSATLYQSPGLKIRSFKIVSPFILFGIVFLFVLFFSYKQFRSKKIKPGLDYFVFGLSGLMGVVMVWFVLYSQHPAMKPNYNLIWAMPLNMLFALVWTIKSWRPKTRYYHVFISTWLLVFLIAGSFLPQEFNLVSYVFVLIVFCRSLLHTLFIFRKNNFINH